MSVFEQTYEEAKANYKPLRRSQISRRNAVVPQRKTDAEDRSDRQLNASHGFLARKPAMNKRGARTKAWDAARAWLHRQFRLKGILTCQIRFPGCWFDREVYFAHPAKRRNLREGELYVVAKACNPCHDQLEIMAPERMRSIVEAAFNNTGIVRKQI